MEKPGWTCWPTNSCEDGSLPPGSLETFLVCDFILHSSPPPVSCWSVLRWPFLQRRADKVFIAGCSQPVLVIFQARLNNHKMVGSGGGWGWLRLSRLSDFPSPFRVGSPSSCSPSTVAWLRHCFTWIPAPQSCPEAGLVGWIWGSKYLAPLARGSERSTWAALEEGELFWVFR